MERPMAVGVALVTAVVVGVAAYFAGTRHGRVTILSHEHKAKDCRGGGNCDVTIKFDCVDQTDPSTCEPYPYQAEVIQTKPGYKINFEIDTTTSFLFDPTDGIKFTSTNSNSYFDCKAQGGNKKYKCDIANNTPPELYKYQIHVTGMNIVDPWGIVY
jgi:hypothetical protein